MLTKEFLTNIIGLKEEERGSDGERIGKGKDFKHKKPGNSNEFESGQSKRVVQFTTLPLPDFR